MRRLARSTYALMVALLPATATVIGVIVLTQIPTIAEIIGVVLVVAAVTLHRDAESALQGPRRAGTAGGPALHPRRRRPSSLFATERAARRPGRTR
jgi:inner membrane transporter RhtA